MRWWWPNRTSIFRSTRDARPASPDTGLNADLGTPLRSRYSAHFTLCVIALNPVVWGEASLQHCAAPHPGPLRSEEHTSELQSLMRISYAVFCLKKKTILIHTQ